jgi:hypothetical protein
VCATGASYLAGFPPTTTCEVDCVVTVNPGVVSAQAKAEVHGTLHFNPANDFDTADVLKFSSVRVLFCGDGVRITPRTTTRDRRGEPGRLQRGPRHEVRGGGSVHRGRRTTAVTAARTACRRRVSEGAHRPPDGPPRRDPEG